MTDDFHVLRRRNHFSPPLTEEQRADVRQGRLDGALFSEIVVATGLSMSRVKTACAGLPAPVDRIREVNSRAQRERSRDPDYREHMRWQLRRTKEYRRTRKAMEKV